jgi:hypothetical protein
MESKRKGPISLEGVGKWKNLGKWESASHLAFLDGGFVVGRFDEADCARFLIEDPGLKGLIEIRLPRDTPAALLRLPDYLRAVDHAASWNLRALEQFKTPGLSHARERVTPKRREILRARAREIGWTAARVESGLGKSQWYKLVGPERDYSGVS